MSFVLGFDYGSRSVGVAVGNTALGTASPLEALKCKEGRVEERALRELVKKWAPVCLVVGLPLDMDGKPMEGITQEARDFGAHLQELFSLSVHFKDERLTTKDAKAMLFEREGFKALKKGKGRIDCISAALIVEGFLEQNPAL